MDQVPARTLWLFMLGSVVAIGALGLWLKPLGTSDPKLLGTLVPVFGLTAVMQLGLSVAFPRIAKEGTPVQTLTLIRCAICEAIAVSGMLAHILGASQAIFVGFMAAALVGVLMARPPTDDAA